MTNTEKINRKLYEEFSKYAEQYDLTKVSLEKVPQKFKNLVLDYRKYLAEAFKTQDPDISKYTAPCIAMMDIQVNLGVTNQLPKSGSQKKCDKCGGTGRIKIYAHIQGGKCFNCMDR